MRISRLALSAMIASACVSGTAFGQTNRTAPRYAPATYYSYYDEDKAAAASPSDEAAPAAPAASSVGSASGCDLGNACDSIGCDTYGHCGSTGLFGFGLLGTGRALDDPWKLCDDPCAPITIGGWTSVGYHSHANPFSFNTFPRNVQLGQQWFFAERVADGSDGLGVGGRIDYLYGTDAPDTQAFGLNVPNWDNTWDNGGQYGHAIPQLYGQVASGDLSVKMGKFWTLEGNEVVAATGNFFYSRQFTFYNSEPFTHTGFVTTYTVDEDTEVYNGYVTGWDSGFRDNGDAYTGGFKRKINDTWTMVFTTVLGRFGEANAPIALERGEDYSVVLIGSLTDKLTFISQSDYLFTRNETGAAARNAFGNINYLLYQVNDRWAFGQRFEWFNYGGAAFGDRVNDDLYNYTIGANYRAHANLLFRPEVRWVWDKTNFGFNEDNAASQAAIGGDMIFTF